MAEREPVQSWHNAGGWGYRATQDAARRHLFRKDSHGEFGTCAKATCIRGRRWDLSLSFSRRSVSRGPCSRGAMAHLPDDSWRRSPGYTRLHILVLHKTVCIQEVLMGLWHARAWMAPLRSASFSGSPRVSVPTCRGRHITLCGRGLFARGMKPDCCGALPERRDGIMVAEPVRHCTAEKGSVPGVHDAKAVYACVQIGQDSAVPAGRVIHRRLYRPCHLAYPYLDTAVIP